MSASDDVSFEGFCREAEPRLRRALVAGFGPERGREAALDALSWGWEHWERIREMDNPVGYLYRVAVRRTRRSASRRQPFPPVPEEGDPWVEPGLAGALARLSRGQRQAVVLVYGFGEPLREAAALLGVSTSTVRTHLERGLVKLQIALGVSEHA